MTVELLFGDVPDAVAGEGELTAAKILDLARQGKLESAMTIKLSLIENQAGSIQFGETVPLVTGRQNVPEGFLIALVMASARSRLLKPLLYVCGVTAAEWLAALVGYSFGHTLEFLIPYGLAFAGGAMLYIVYKELIPESHGDGHEIPSTFAFIIGTLTMIGLTHWLG